MKLAVLLSVLALGLSTAACANTSDSSIGDDSTTDSGTGGGHDGSSSSGQDGGSGSDGASSNACPMHCTTDNECESSCPKVPNAIHCCDTMTGVCYASATQTCPQPNMDAGDMPD